MEATLNGEVKQLNEKLSSLAHRIGVLESNLKIRGDRPWDEKTHAVRKTPEGPVNVHIMSQQWTRVE